MEHKQVSIFDVISEQNKTEEYFCNHEINQHYLKHLKGETFSTIDKKLKEKFGDLLSNYTRKLYEYMASKFPQVDLFDKKLGLRSGLLEEDGTLYFICKTPTQSTPVRVFSQIPKEFWAVVEDE